MDQHPDPLAPQASAGAAMSERANPELALLIHSGCGHIAGASNLLAVDLAEQKRAQLALSGHSGWRVEVRQVTDEELVGLIAGERCDVCRLDR